MKKLSVFLATTLLVAVLFSSCTSHQKCPAYGKVKTEKGMTKSV